MNLGAGDSGTASEPVHYIEFCHGQAPAVVQILCARRFGDRLALITGSAGDNDYASLRETFLTAARKLVPVHA